MVIWGWIWCVSLWVKFLNTLLDVLTYISMCYHTRYHTFMGFLYHSQCTTIIRSLLHRLLYVFLYIFCEISIYLYGFQRVTTAYHHFFFKKRSMLILFEKLMVTRRNALENWQLCTYFTENVLEDIH